jgi:alpha-tubulin suppressor-like RCC1 family protein
MADLGLDKQSSTVIKDYEAAVEQFHQPTDDNFTFTQIECGANHTLLLSKAGDVFSFGQGLNGQLGTNQRIIH